MKEYLFAGNKNLNKDLIFYYKFFIIKNGTYFGGLKMKLWKYLLIAILIFSALIQLVYGSVLMIFPDKINTTINFGDLISNESVQMLIFIYGKVFISFALLSVLTAVLVIKDSPFGMIFTLGWVIGMSFGGVLSFIKTGNISYIFADLARALIIFVILILYYFMYYRKNKVLFQ